jgi:signal transduction histidine kinase
VHENAMVGVALIASLSAPEFSDQDRRLFQAMVARATSGIVQHLLQETAETRAAELAAVIESIPDAVLVGEEDSFRHANRAALTLLGARSVDEVNRQLNGPHEDIEIRHPVTGTLIPREQRLFTRALRGETVNEEVALRKAGAAGDLVLRVAAAPVRLGNRVAGAVIVGTDVTGQKRSALERQRVFEQAQQAVADRDHILAVVSHELRNPLHTISMAAGILKDLVPVPEMGQKSIASIQRATARMSRMIQDLLDVSVIQAGVLAIDPRPLDVGGVVEEVVEGFEAEAAERGLGVEVEIEEGLPRVRADRDRLYQALANLVSNALKVTTQGGAVIGARLLDERNVALSVRDTGPGIPEDQLDRLFEPYWRGQSTYKGAGLGLAITRGIVEAHGGRIWLESVPRAGTTFYFTVPKA